MLSRKLYSFIGLEILRKRYGRSCSSCCSVRSAKDIHHLLDQINEKVEVHSFFGKTFVVDDKIRGLFGLDLADILQCDRQHIYDTGIIGSETLLLPYTGVDIDGVVNGIIEASNITTTSPRSKFLLATLRGVGGGKTRLIEETRIRLGLLYPNWLPIAITFNHKMSISDSDFVWKDPQMIVAYAVCSRIIATVYNISVTEARIRINEALKGTESGSVAEMELLAENLIVGTINHIAARMKRVKLSVDSFVLFVDESMKLIDESDILVSSSDPYRQLRNTILGDRVGKVLNTALLMTSLDISVFGKTESDRTIVPVVLASKLPIDHVVDKIWIPSLNSSSTASESDKHILKWLAATVNSAPRLVELMGLALKKEFENTWPISRQGRSLSVSLDAVLTDFDRRKRLYYSVGKFPSGKHLHGLINGKFIDVDDLTQEYVRGSVFTNSIPRFQRNKDEKLYLVPESALYLLVGLKTIDSEHSIEKEIQKECGAIWSDLKGHINSPPQNQGQPLEDVFARVLRMRLLSTHLKELNPRQTNLLDLLALDLDQVMFTINGGPYKAASLERSTPQNPMECNRRLLRQNGVMRTVSEWISNTLEFGNDSASSTMKLDVLYNLLHSSVIVPTSVRIGKLPNTKGGEGWISYIKDVDSNLAIVKPRLNNPFFDLMMLVKLFPNSAVAVTTAFLPGEVVLVFEKKSKAEDDDFNEIWPGHFDGTKKRYYQYHSFCEMVSRISDDDLVGDKGYLRALKEGRFVYIYVTTHHGPTLYLDPKDLNQTADTSLGVFVFNRDVTQQMMGIAFEVFALTR